MIRKIPKKQLSDIVKVSTERKNPQDFPNFQYIGMADVESGTGKILTECFGREMKATSASFRPGDVLYGRLRPYLNKVVRANSKGLASTEFIVLRPLNGLNSSYLAWRLRADDFVNYANSLNTGDRPRVKFEQIASFNVEYPGPEIQNKTVDTIETQFTRLDAAVNSLKTIKTKLETYRQSVLKTVFLENSNKKWSEFTIDELALKIQYGLTSQSDINYKGPKYLRITDIQDRRVDWEAVPHAKETKKVSDYALNKGDLVFARTGATVGKSYLIKECPKNAVFASYLIRIVPDSKKIIPELLWYYFQSPMYWSDIKKSQRGIGQPNVNGKLLSELKLKMPIDLEVQQSLVADIESRFSIIDKLEETVNNALLKAERLRRSILKAAFEEKLVKFVSDKDFEGGL